MSLDNNVAKLRKKAEKEKGCTKKLGQPNSSFTL